MSAPGKYDLVVIGSGPGGQKAAIQASKAGARVAVVERAKAVGGHCVHSGTIPSKTFRETTLAFDLFRARSGGLFGLHLPQGTKVESLMQRLDSVVSGHVSYISEQLARNGVEVHHGEARFFGPHEVGVRSVDGTQNVLRGDQVLIATGSRPWHPPEVPVDHEHILDSDSILSITYLPRSLVVLGGGVIGSEYASIFSALGVEVTLVDACERPLDFLEPDLATGFLRAFRDRGGRFLPNVKPTGVRFDGIHVQVSLSDGFQAEAEKVLCAMGRLPNLEDLGLEHAGLELDGAGHLPVDAAQRTKVPHIFAAGDVAGSPSLASWAMEEGRRAARNALGLGAPAESGPTPCGIYTIPEMATVGLTEEQARKTYGSAIVGLAHYREIARGHVAGVTDGLLKMITDPAGQKVVGVHILGEGATELIHVGQMGLLMGATPDVFVENTFNFPTFAEAYRVAALSVVGQRARIQESTPESDAA